MVAQIKMPALSPTMTEGKLSKWLIEKSSKVVSGDVIAEIETDKATMEIEAVDDGVLYEIFVERLKASLKRGVSRLCVSKLAFSLA